MITKHEALDTLDRLEFFQGQRAGRELWFEKNSQLQDIDIACFVRDISNLREYIQTADVAPRAEWISVEERLPDVCGMPVLMVAENEYGQTNVVKGFTDYTCPIVFRTNEMEYYGIWRAWKVTHWMPLPEPPDMKGGE